LTEYVISDLVNSNRRLINTVIDNMGYERYLIQHLKHGVKNLSYITERTIFNEIMNNEKIINEIKKNIYTENTILHDLDVAGTIGDKSTERYKTLHSNIINVDEYKC